jgi:hypothetical protein
MKHRLFLLSILLFVSGCAGTSRIRTYAQVNVAPAFSFDYGQRIAVLPVTVSGHPTIKFDPTTTTSFAIHFTKIGYQVFEIDQLRAEAKRMGVSLPDTIRPVDYPLIAQATGIRQVLQANLEYTYVPAKSYSTTPSQPSTIVATNNPFAVGFAAGSASQGEAVSVGENYSMRAETFNIVDAQSGSVLARGIVGAGPYSMSEQMSYALYNEILARKQ